MRDELQARADADSMQSEVDALKAQHLLSEYLKQFLIPDERPIVLMVTPGDFIKGAACTKEYLRITHRDWDMADTVVITHDNGMMEILKSRHQRPYHYTHRVIVRPWTLMYDL